jgi:DNA-binding winged helix-turn-helix (wHTH) protein/tetratricopeptide (TPR) repeat protein
VQAVKEITFGQFRLDFTNECLWEGTRAISLRPKAFAVLKLLIENPGQLVSKQQVLDTVWPGTFVGDAVLKDNIRQLREALEDDAGSPIYIETAHRRGYRFIGKPSEPVPSKNSTESVLVSPLAPKIATSASSAAEIGILGRDPELAKLRGWLDHALAGDRQLVFVTGEAGIGKTTLVQTFLKQAEGVPGIRVVRGQCLEHYGAGEAYLPVLDGFSRLCRSHGGDHVLKLLRNLAPTWLAQMPSLVPQSERATLQSQTAGATRERMLREMAEAIETLSSETPLLLFLEDLHWSDYSTLDLISFLARRRDPARLLIIGTYRPVDVIVADHPLKSVKRELQAHGLCCELALECLSEEAVAQYLATRFPGHQFPNRLSRTVYQRTEGTPLFMVDLVEYLADEKAIVEEQGNWKLRVDLSEVERGVPSNVRDLIQKQIERLSPDERAVLEAASVAGMECSSVAIASGLENTVEWVEEHCEELARRHQFLSPAWLVELPDGTVTPRHRFIHVLYKEVPYRLMAPMRRSQIHRRIGERGIEIYGNRASEIAAELAMHFEQSRDWPRAVEYLLQAAENAVTRSAHHEAIDLATRGLEGLKLLSESTERAKLEMKLRMILTVSLMAIKGFASADAEEINAHGRELFWRHGRSPELFYMLWTLNLYRQFRGEMNSSLEIAHQLMELAEDLKDDVLIMQAHRALGAVLVLLGRCGEALEHIEKGTALCAVRQDHCYSVFVVLDSEVMFECFAAMALLELGYPDRSAEKIAAGLELARKLGHPQTLVVALHIAAQLHHLRGEAPLVFEHAREAIEIADEYGLAVWRAYGLMELGWAVAERGDAQDGIEKIQRGLAEYEATGAKLRCPYFLGLLADQLGKAGRPEEAIAIITKAITLAEQTGEGYALPELHRIKGELLLNSKDLRKAGKAPGDSSGISTLSEARTCFAEALTIAKQQGARWRQLRTALSMYRLEKQQGKADHTQLAEICSSFTEGFETADLKQAKELLDTAASRTQRARPS